MTVKCCSVNDVRGKNDGMHGEVETEHSDKAFVKRKQFCSE